MRSRLEARYAAELDQDGVSWEYEPRAFAGLGGQYLPDFVIRGALYLEVKPTIEMAWTVMPKMQVIWESIPGAPLYVVVPGVGIYRTLPSGVWRWYAGAA